jgi:hypothetical protein
LFRTALTEFVIGRGKSLAVFITTVLSGLRRAAAALAGLFTGRGKSAAYAGTAMALAGIGIAVIAATTSPAAVPAAVSSGHHADAAHGFAVSVGDQASRPASPAATSKPAAAKAPAHSAAADKPAAAKAPAHTAAPAKPAAHKAPAHKAAPAKPAAHKAPAHKAAPAKPAARKAAPKRAAKARSSHPLTWKQIRDRLAAQTYPKPAPHKLPLPDRLLPASPSGAQTYMPITASRLANASTIVRQALKRHMGVRSAVIAVATAMQESTLQNITYGDRDSLGLFQQRPSCGWGSAAQITNPAYAANAFLSALHTHQSADPEWASQPLWATAQAVQQSGFPYAYAKWESQAAQLVQRVASHLG